MMGAVIEAETVYPIKTAHNLATARPLSDQRSTRRIALREIFNRDAKEYRNLYSCMD
jgi:hypothetical protein